MTDEATITVIATGLETAVPKQTAGGIGNRMVYPTQNAARPSATQGLLNRTAATTPVTNRPVNPEVKPSTQMPGIGINVPKRPESTVKPVEINIPDFLKNSKR